MPRTPDGPTPRDTYLRVRLTRDQKARVERRAREADMTVSQWVRARLGGG